MHQEMCEKHLRDALSAADRLLELAGDQINSCDHDNCLVLDGIIRDCAMQIRKSVGECEDRVLESKNQN